MYNNFDLVKLLVDKGANINCYNYWNCKPANSALDLAIENNKDKKIIDFLLPKGAE